MVFDFDDFHEENHRLDLLHELRRINPDFRCTLFAIPAKCSPDFIATVPEWCELAMHGYEHSSVYECADWSYARTLDAMIDRPGPFVRGFKAPGWQISDACFQALARQGWWCADHPDNRERRPEGLPIYDYTTYPASWHGHIQNDCGNGLEETWTELTVRVKLAHSFSFVSEVVSPWHP